MRFWATEYFKTAGLLPIERPKGPRTFLPAGQQKMSAPTDLHEIVAKEQGLPPTRTNRVMLPIAGALAGLGAELASPTVLTSANDMAQPLREMVQ
jgi:hypothetical protein